MSYLIRSFIKSTLMCKHITAKWSNCLCSVVPTNLKFGKSILRKGKGDLRVLEGLFKTQKSLISGHIDHN